MIHLFFLWVFFVSVTAQIDRFTNASKQYMVYNYHFQPENEFYVHNALYIDKNTSLVSLKPPPPKFNPRYRFSFIKVGTNRYKIRSMLTNKILTYTGNKLFGQSGLKNSEFILTFNQDGTFYMRMAEGPRLYVGMSNTSALELQMYNVSNNFLTRWGVVIYK